MGYVRRGGTGGGCWRLGRALRARNIKPGFFVNEDLAACSPLARLLFAGLWCMADRAGRLEDRPARIRAQVLPYDQADADALLDELAEGEFILRYEAEGVHCIQIARFAEHQRPHANERESRIPALPGYEALAALVPRVDAPGDPEDEGLATKVESASYQGDKHLLPRLKALRPESPNAESLNVESRLQEGVGAPAGATTTTGGGDEIEQAAEILAGARFIGDDVATIAEALERGYGLVSEFRPRDGPLLAELFCRWYTGKRSPPADWFAMWCRWMRREVQERQERPTDAPEETFAEKRARWEQGIFHDEPRGQRSRRR